MHTPLPTRTPEAYTLRYHIISQTHTRPLTHTMELTHSGTPQSLGYTPSLTHPRGVHTQTPHIITDTCTHRHIPPTPVPLYIDHTHLYGRKVVGLTCVDPYTDHYRCNVCLGFITKAFVCPVPHNSEFPLKHSWFTPQEQRAEVIGSH